MGTRKNSRLAKKPTKKKNIIANFEDTKTRNAKKILDEQIAFAAKASSAEESKGKEDIVLITEAEKKLDDKTKELYINIAKEYRNGIGFNTIRQKYNCTTYRVYKALEYTNTEIRPGNGGASVKKKKNTFTVTRNSTNSSKRTSFNFAGKDFYYNNLTRYENPNYEDFEVVVAGLVKDRHNIQFIKKYVFETFSNDEFSIARYSEDKATDFITSNFDLNSEKPKLLVLYCTGLQLALSAVISACAKYNINCITMHYNSDTEEYLSQKTLTIFNEVSDELLENVTSKATSIFDKISADIDVLFYNTTAEELIESKQFITLSLIDFSNSSKKTTRIFFNTTSLSRECLKIFDDMVFHINNEDIAKERSCAIFLEKDELMSDTYYSPTLEIAKAFNQPKTNNN
mgnify:FL=1